MISQKKSEIIDISGNNHINEVIKKLDTMYNEKLGSTGLSIIHNSGCGQEIKHYHLHVTPRYVNDDVKCVSNKDLLVDIV